MKDNIKLATVVVTRPTTKTEVQTPVTYDTIEGLPPYYNLSFSLTILIIGIMVTLLQLIIPILGIIIILLRRKKYVCTQCGKEFYKLETKPKVCNVCGGTLVPAAKQ